MNISFDLIGADKVMQDGYKLEQNVHDLFTNFNEFVYKMVDHYRENLVDEAPSRDNKLREVMTVKLRSASDYNRFLIPKAPVPYLKWARYGRPAIKGKYMRFVVNGTLVHTYKVKAAAPNDFDVRAAARTKPEIQRGLVELGKKVFKL